MPKIRKQFPYICEARVRDKDMWRVHTGRVFAKQQNFYFATHAEAKEKARTWKETIDAEGSAARKLSDSERVDAHRAITLLAKHKVSLEHVAAYWIKHAAPPSGILAWEEAIDKWLAAPRSRPLAEVTKIAYRNSVRMLQKELTPKDILSHQTSKIILPHQVSKKHVEDFLTEDDWEAATVTHHLRNIRCFYGWALKAQHVGENPALGIPEPESLTEVTILTPQEVVKLLESASDVILPAISICLFAGLRTSEVRRLDWAQVGEDEIEIQARKTKTRRNRMVPISPTLRKWLDSFTGLKTGMVAPSEWRECFDELTLAAGWRTKEGESTWPHNAMRHSYGTYRMAQIKNESLVSYEMGNSPDIVHKNYRKVVAKAATESYWNIQPSKPANVIAMKTS
jgi:integrase